MPEAKSTTPQATADQEAGLRARAREFAAPLLEGEAPHSGEPLLAHADAVADILAGIGCAQSVQASVYLSYASGQLNRPEAVLSKSFGSDLARLAMATARLEHLQERSRSVSGDSDFERSRRQTETIRKMLLAFGRDLRVVLLRLASRLQTLRHCSSHGRPVPPDVLREARDVLAPLANRLGIGQIKWQLEDQILRAQEPDTYHHIAALLKERRAEREHAMARREAEIQAGLGQAGIAARVSGRPKNISSIVRKMRGKDLPFERVFDVRALRILVDSVPDCYLALDWVHAHYTPVTEEFDDYIAHPKVNGYQSIHTVVRDAQDKAWEIQIRTQQMHAHAETGVAAHWAYKEAGKRGYSGVSAGGEYDAKIAVLRQLLTLQDDYSGPALQHGLLDDRIYVFTPEANVIELPAGATAVDFAYSVHTELGHRCRGARVDGAMVPLNTPLQNGQTVEVMAAKSGGPSRDWLNPELGYLASPRSRAKARAWFNAQRVRETIARGRDVVERLLQREGRTALALDDLAGRLGFKSADALFETVGKDEMPMRTLEAAVRPQAPTEPAPPAPQALSPGAEPHPDPGGVLVVGVDSLLTQTARCCKPAPPDPIAGYVTRGRGVSVHRVSCPNFQGLQEQHPERVIRVDWSPASGQGEHRYPVDITIRAANRPGMLRDISDIFARQKMNVTNVRSQSGRDESDIRMTVFVGDTRQLDEVLRTVRGLRDVRFARRH